MAVVRLFTEVVRYQSQRGRLKIRDGRLTRGVRAVLAHHVLYDGNRAGTSARHQAFFAATAAQVVFQHTPASTTPPACRSASSAHLVQKWALVIRLPSRQ